jgi:SPP1 gp7 family putative phage head morphogenesis protein
VNDDQWSPKRRIEFEYFKSLKKLMRVIQKAIEGIQDPYSILSIIRNSIYSDDFNKLAQKYAKKMVTSLFTDSGHTWREAAQESSQGRIIYNALKKEMEGPVGKVVRDRIDQNAELIRTLPIDTANQISQYVAQETLKGKRSNAIAKEIQGMIPQESSAKAALIARTEVSKAQTALTYARSKELGINWYMWKTAKDQRVRESHKKMSDVLINWNDPPAPEELTGEHSAGHYDAGDIYNCRCFPMPITDLRLVKWPAKVYSNESIAMMTLTQFQNIT